MISCGRLVAGPFRVVEGLRWLTTVAQLAKLPHKSYPGIAMQRTRLYPFPIYITWT